MRWQTTYVVTLIWVIMLPVTEVISQSYNFMNYGIAEGLVHDQVTDICEDSFGNIWIATLGGGLSSFNGIEFNNLTVKDGLSSNYVRAVLVDSEGRSQEVIFSF